MIYPKIKLHFIIFSEKEINQSLISEIILRKPSSIGIKGEKSKYGAVLQDHYLLYTITSQDTYDLSDVIEQLKSIISPNAEELKRLKEKERYSLKLNVIVEIFSNDYPSLFLPEEDISFFAKLGMAIDFDFYNL